MNTTFHMFHDRGSILSARCCSLPTCEGCACLFWSLPLLFDPRDETWHHNPNSKDTISYRYMYFFFYSIFFLRQFCSEHWANRCGTTSSSRVPLWVSSHKCLAMSRRCLGPPCVPAVTFVFRQYGRTCEGHSDCCLDSYRCGRCCSLKKNKKQDAAF